MYSLVFCLILFSDYKPIRIVSETGLLGDVLSHCDKTLYYEDPLTLFHENVHRANSLLHKKYAKPGYYMLNDECVILEHEPRTTLQQIAWNVPYSLRNHQSYQHYLVKLAQPPYQNNQFPSVIFDEWIAYSHTSKYRLEIKQPSGESEVEYMMAFTMYSAVLAQMCPETIEFVKPHMKIVFETYTDSLPNKPAADYLLNVINSNDTKELRKFMREKLEISIGD